MQFSPRKRDIYISYIRNHIHGRIINNGITLKNLKQLKKINIYSICHTEKLYTATDVKLFSSITLYCTQALLFQKGLSFNIKINGDSVNFVDRKALRAILCETALLAAKMDGYVYINILDEGIKVTYKGISPTKTLKRLLKAQNALFTKNDDYTYSLFVYQKKTDKSEKITGAVSLLTDPLSSIKIFTSEI